MKWEPRPRENLRFLSSVEGLPTSRSTKVPVAILIASNMLYGQNISISDDLFRCFDFKGPSSSQVPDVSFVGFDDKSNPIAVIDYR